MIRPDFQIFSYASELQEQISALTAKLMQLKRERFEGICGFDGFVDTFIRMQNPSTMAQFAERTQGAAGVSASYESHHLGDKFGGNGPLLASALHGIFRADIDISYFGALGRPSILPIFKEALGGKMKALYSMAEPAHSDCLEFRDGKIMLSDLRSCTEIDWERLLETVGASELDALLRGVHFIAAANWGKLVNVGSLWKNLALRLAELGVPEKQVIFFMDLAEFEQRPMSDRLELLQIVSEVSMQCRTILSLNLKEAWQMAAVFGRNFLGRKRPDEVGELTGFLKRMIQVDTVIVHPNSGAACASKYGVTYIPGPYCNNPLISVGAGDNFGAGCLAAALYGFDDTSLLITGVCTSGYFVRSGRSPSWPQISQIAAQWGANCVPERFVEP